MSIDQILNEEIGNFDFLSMERIKSEDTYQTIITSKEFQVSLIYSLINRLKERDVISGISVVIENANEQSNKYDSYLIEKSYTEIIIDFKFTFKEKKYNMTVMLCGDKGSYDNFDINFYNKHGEKIDYSWVENNINLKKALIKSLITFVLKK